MKIKNILFVLFAVMLTTNAFSQTTFGLRGGVNFFTLTGKDGDGDKIENNKIKTGFNIGVNAEIPVGIDFYAQPGLLFSTKGAKYSSPDGSVNISYIEVPVNFIYKPELGDGHLILGFGPYAAFAVGGKYKVGNASGDIEFESEVPALAPPNYYLKRFDAGGNMLFGYQMKNGLSVQLDAQLGLVNINTKREGVDDESSLKNTGFGVSLGYRFGK